MIVPRIYKDELLYSWAARTMAYSYVSYSYFCQQFLRTQEKWSIDFYNDIFPEYLTRGGMTWEQAVWEHTMARYALMLIQERQRAEAMSRLLSGDNTYIEKLTLPTRTGRYLRYCPLCAQENRERLGETFWHRKHQMFGVHLCPKHGCFLVDSKVAYITKQYDNLHTAEEEYRPSLVRYGSPGEKVMCRLLGRMLE